MSSTIESDNKMNGPSDESDDLARTIGLDEGHPASRRKAWITAIIAILFTAGVLMGLLRNGDDAEAFKKAEAQRGDLVITVTATGELEPLNQVDVGTEVSGTIEAIEADYNDRVKAGQVLARLDPAKFEAQVLQSEASLKSAEATLLQAEATLAEAQSELERFKRVCELSGGKVPSQNDLDKAEATLARARADKASARARIAEAEATLSLVQTDLDKAIIRAPIDGIVLEREVELGQTVAASLQTPVLFTLAEDLGQMELLVGVDEADVGQVKEGQVAAFTVDAYPDRTFPASVVEVRFAPQTSDGVVTYETVLSVDNSDLLLRPGMTATADITVERLEDALLVPNAALRFTPPLPEKGTPEKDLGLVASLMPRPGRRSKPERRPTTPTDGGRQRVWILREGHPVPIPVRTGSSDGLMTEVLEGDVEPGLALLVDIERTEK